MSRRGQASLELIALLPIIVVACLAAVQVVGMLAASSAAQDRARARAMDASGPSGGMVTVTGAVRPPALPGLEMDRVRVAASVRVP